MWIDWCIMKQYHYKNYPVIYEIYIQDTIIPEKDVGRIGNISRNIDYPDLTEFRNGECSFDINDPEGDFSPTNNNNFFTRLDPPISKDGNNASVEIKTGFLVNGVRILETIFTGSIIRITQSGKPGVNQIICSDRLRSLKRESVIDFGVARNFMLLANTANPESSNGEYPILNAVLPASEGSVVVYDAFDRSINLADELATEGSLEPTNYVVGKEGVSTEGSLLENVGIAYPQIEMKSPYRNIQIDDIISKIIAFANITDYEVEIPKQEVDSYFSSLGRFGYDFIGNIGSSNPITWEGHVTDFIYDDDKFYALYNAPRGSVVNRSKLVEYDPVMNTYTTLYRAPAGVEFWKLSKYMSNIAIMASETSLTPQRDYDALDVAQQNHILLWDGSEISDPPFVPKNVALAPQLGHFYQLGSNDYAGGIATVNSSNKVLPDTRRSMIYHNNSLYYGYVDTMNSVFGVAKATNPTAQTALFEVDIDENLNHLGFSFHISGTQVSGSVTFRIADSSKIVGFRDSL